MRAADNVAELFRRLNGPETETDSIATSVQRKSLLKILESSATRTMNALQDMSRHALQNGDHTNETLKKLNELTAVGADDQTNIINFMHQYSDILLNVMQQKMAGANK